MEKYILFTDSACDLKPEVLKEWGVENINLSLRFDGDSKRYRNDEMDISVFYDEMRNGKTAKTSAVNPDEFANAFENILKDGSDILYLGFSSGLSTTFNSSRIAAEELKEKYPERKIICVDSLCASAGQGFLLYLAVQKKNEGADIESLAEYLENIKLSVCHWFTVDDLVYLKRGGRISPTLAFVGAVLGIKPVLHVDNEGKLVSVTKARGRKAALNALIDKFEQLSLNDEKTVFICQADCFADAEFLKENLEKKYKTDVKIITDIGPVIGAHAGPGTLAIFFIGKER